jgi:hypothetical protein
LTPLNITDPALSIPSDWTLLNNVFGVTGDILTSSSNSYGGQWAEFSFTKGFKIDSPLHIQVGFEIMIDGVRVATYDQPIAQVFWGEDGAQFEYFSNDSLTHVCKFRSTSSLLARVADGTVSLYS